MATFSYDDVSSYTLDDADEVALLAAQDECTFIWSNREGWPVGVIMSYVWPRGRLLAERVVAAGPGGRSAA